MTGDNLFHGLITKDEFQASCKEIVERNKQIKDSFDICHFEVRKHFFKSLNVFTYQISSDLEQFS